MSTRLRSIPGNTPGRRLSLESPNTHTTIETRLDVYECTRGHRFALCRHATADFILSADCRCGSRAVLADAPWDTINLDTPTHTPKTHLDHARERRTPAQRDNLLNEALARIAA